MLVQVLAMPRSLLAVRAQEEWILRANEITVPQKVPCVQTPDRLLRMTSWEKKVRFATLDEKILHGRTKTCIKRHRESDCEQGDTTSRA